MKKRKQAYIILIILMVISFVFMHDESWILISKLTIIHQKQYIWQIISASCYFIIGIIIDYSSLKFLYDLLDNRIVKLILNRAGKLALKIIANIEPLYNYLSKSSDSDELKEAIELGSNNYNALLEEKANIMSFYGIALILF